MLFQSLEFFLFFFIISGAYFLYSPRNRQPLLLLASYYFYMSWDYRFGTLILFSTAIDYYAGILIEDSTDNSRMRKIALITSLATNLGVLGVFKYLNFFIQSLVDITEAVGIAVQIDHVAIILPVGISFFTFQSMSHTIDVYRGSLKAERDFSRFALFVAFFPQLVAGPIVRASEFLPQLQHTFKFSWARLAWGVEKFLMGLVKKVVIADNMSPLVDLVYENPDSFGSSMLWAATICYAIQIYADFSGYSDMAIGCARILGFKIPENFNMPYLSRTPSEFWSRWHMTLSRWLRDYLYIPLGGNRNGTSSTYRNLMITMILGGLWHGASYNFLLWGFGHGLLLCAYRALDSKIKSFVKSRALIPAFLSTMLFFSFVLLLWVPFRAATLSDTLIIWQRMLIPEGISSGAELSGINYPVIIFGLTIVTLAHLFGSLRHPFSQLTSSAVPRRALSVGVLVFLVLEFHYDGVAPFVYFQF